MLLKRIFPLVMALLLFMQCCPVLAANIASEAITAKNTAVPMTAPAPEEEAPAPVLEYEVLQTVSLTSLINRDSRLPEGYEPEGLVWMKAFNTSGNLTLRKSSILIHQEAAQALNTMMAAAKSEGITGFVLDNAYRSHAKQTTMFNRKVKKNPAYSLDRNIPLSTAIPGASEHEAGLAIDICGKKHRSMNEAFGASSYGVWLGENCHKYGFILRYPKGKEHLTGIVYEPWHFRYVGVELSMELYEKGWVLEEYYQYLLPVPERMTQKKAFTTAK